MHQEDVVNPEVLRYLNRLSDLFFTLARVCNARAGVEDVFYLRSKKHFVVNAKQSKNK
jgi:cob(I)alamin adenosyltransferase